MDLLKICPTKTQSMSENLYSNWMGSRIVETADYSMQVIQLGLLKYVPTILLSNTKKNWKILK